MRRVYAFGLVAPIIALAACKPPPTDAGLDRDMPVEEPTYASEPLPSPETKGAVWAPSSQDGRIIYGIPGEPALLALECVDIPAGSDVMRLTRLAPADEGASALMAIIGNGAIGRIEVESVERGGGFVWQGEVPAYDTRWEPLSGPRQITVTVPGAGMVTVNPSDMPRNLLSACRNSPLAE